MNRGAWLLAIAVVQAVLADSREATATGEAVDLEKRCAVAWELLETRELALARAGFLELLNDAPELACAREGYDATNERRRQAMDAFAAGQDLAALGTPEALEGARRRYLEALAVDPSRDDIRLALASLGTQTPAATVSGEYKAALELRRAGYTSAARERAIAVVKDFPDDPIPKELAASVKDRAQEVFESLGALLAALGLALVALWLGWHLLLKVASYWPWSRNPQVVIGEFDDPSGDMAIGQTLRVRIADELDLARSTAPSIRKVEGAGADIDLVDALPSEVKFVRPFIEWVRRPLRYTLKGFAHAPGGGEAELSVTITDPRGRVVAAQAFRNSRPREADAHAYLDLAIDAAAWALFELQRLRYPMTSANRLTMSGALHWRSYAEYRHGERLGDEDGMVFLHRALERDHRNIAALIRIGQAQTEKIEDKDAFDAGICHLEQARRILAGDQPVGGSRPGVYDPYTRSARRRLRRALRVRRETRVRPHWYEAEFALAKAYLHRFARDEDESKAPSDDLDRAIEVAVELARAIGATQETLRSRWRQWSIRPEDRRTLRLMLDREATRYLVGVLAGSQASKEWYERKPLDQATPESRDARPHTSKALADLKLANLPPARELIKDILSEASEHASADTHYNLACYYARTRQPTQSIEWLRKSFEHNRDEILAENLDWALKDPTLEPLRKLAPVEYAQLMSELKARTSGHA